VSQASQQTKFNEHNHWT